jgi:hypothetical protein
MTIGLFQPILGRQQFCFGQHHREHSIHNLKPIAR